MHSYFLLSFRDDAIFEKQILVDKEPYASSKIMDAVEKSKNEDITFFLTGELPLGSMYVPIYQMI